MRVPERLLLGPGPSPVSPRVMQAMGSPIVSHLDPAMMALLDDLRLRLGWAFGADSGTDRHTPGCYEGVTCPDAGGAEDPIAPARCGNSSLAWSAIRFSR